MQEIVWQGPAAAEADWLDPGNWEPPSPQRFFEFLIDNGGTAVLSGGLVRGQFGTIGESNSGTLLQTGGRFDLLAIDPNFIQPLFLGVMEGSLGRYELAGGEVRLAMQIGLLGEGQFVMSGGSLDLVESMQVASQGRGVVEHQGGIIRGDPDRQTIIRLGTDWIGEATYSLGGTGELLVDSVAIGRGSFVQSGGRAAVSEIGMTGRPDSAALIHLLPGDHELSTGALSIFGEGDATNTRFLQDGGKVQAANTFISNGVYEIHGGTLSGKRLSLNGESRGSDVPSRSVFQQSGGSVRISEELTIGAGRSPSGEASPGRYELIDGSLQANRLRMTAQGAVAEFHQRAGTVAVDQLQLEGSLASEGLARYRMEGGALRIRRDWVLANETSDGFAELDLTGQPVLIETGVGSYVRFGANAQLRGTENATLHVGPDSLVAVPVGLNLESVFGTFVHDNVVVYHPGEVIHVGPDQRAQVAQTERFQQGIVVDGTIYDGPTFGTAQLFGQFRVNPGGTAELSGLTLVNVENSLDAGVYGGDARLGQLHLNGARLGDVSFTVDDGGVLRASDYVLARGTGRGRADLTLADGHIESNHVWIAGRNAAYRQSAGSLVTEDLRIGAAGFEVGATLFTTGELSNGSIETRDFTITAQSSFVQSGGSVEAQRLSMFGNSTYRLENGELVLGANLTVIDDSNVLDLADSTAIISTVGAILPPSFPRLVRNAQNATLNVNSESLVFIEPGTDLSAVFGQFHNAGIIHEVGMPLTIPADRTIRGDAEFDQTVPRLDIFGRLLADEGYTMLLPSFHIHPGAEVDVQRGVARSPAPAPDGPDLRSRLDGGTLRGRQLSVAGGTNSRFFQTGGEASFDTVTIGQDATYELSGGSLTVNRELRGGTLDFADAAASLRIAGGAIFDVEQTAFVRASGASLFGDAFSMIVVPPGFEPSQMIGTFHTDGVIYERGSPLVVDADRGITGNPVVSDDVTNQGIISPGYGLGRVTIEGADYHQGPGGKLVIDVGGRPVDVFTQDPAAMGSDRLVVDGDAWLDGTLEVRLLKDFVPLSSFAYTVVFATNSLHGQFANASSTVDILGGGRFDVEYGPQSVRLTNFQPAAAVPEPTSWSLLAILCFCLMMRRCCACGGRSCAATISGIYGGPEQPLACPSPQPARFSGRVVGPHDMPKVSGTKSPESPPETICQAERHDVTCRACATGGFAWLSQNQRPRSLPPV